MSRRAVKHADAVEVDGEKIEYIETIRHVVYWSRDHWVTIYEQRTHNGPSKKLSGDRVDRVRYLGLVAHGGGRDDARR